MRFSKGYDADKEKDTGLDKMSMEMESLFKLFLENNNKFNPNKSFSALKKYFKKYERIIYAPISNFIFMDIDRIEDDERDILGTIYSNIDKTYEYAKKQTSDNEQEQEIISKIVIALIKMRDHVNLASNQYKSLKQSDDEFKSKFKKIIKPVQDKMERKISSQLISLVGIFTAMAFLIFGGISVLGEIAYGFQNASMIKLIMITSLWGLCIINMIFTFLFCVSKMTKLNFASKKGSFLVRYPVIWFSNWILITIFVISSWLYFCDQIGIMEIMIRFIYNRPYLVFVSIFVLISIASIILIVLLLKKYKRSRGIQQYYE